MKAVTDTTGTSQGLRALHERLAPLRAQLAAHPLYRSIDTLDELILFMQSHVFAVWDFMCLLKSLQRALTSIDTLWFPTSHPECRRFINEIVLGEESDEYEGRPISHYELYLEAMRRAGADPSAIERVVAACRSGDQAEVEQALERAPVAASQFVRSAFRLIREGSLAAQAAAFAFGREDAIPNMFRALVRDLNREMDGDLTQFVWYLERHIEVDGDEHGPLAMLMISDICGDDRSTWEQAAESAEDAIRSRLALWDGILSQLHG